MSVRGQHCIDHADTKQKPLMGPDCLLGVVPQPTGSRLSETILCNDLFSSSDDDDQHRHAIDQYAYELKSAALML